MSVKVLAEFLGDHCTDLWSSVQKQSVSLSHVVSNKVKRGILVWMSWEEERYYMMRCSCSLCVCIAFCFWCAVSFPYLIASLKLNLHLVKSVLSSKVDLGERFSVLCWSHRPREQLCLFPWCLADFVTGGIYQECHQQDYWELWTSCRSWSFWTSRLAMYIL